ncbi:ABC transporter substrate-binding protein [Candidatus Bipolaricaulota bacterium]
MRGSRGAVLVCLVVFSVVAAGQSLPTLRFSLPPVLEALPIAFANAWGLFEERGLEVELIGFSDIDERSAALHTGNLDGLMSDVTHAILDAYTGLDLVITGAARSRPQTGSIALGFLSPAVFHIDSLQALFASTQLMGVIYRSDYEYLLNRLIESTPGGEERTARYSNFTDMLQLATMLGAQWLGSAVLPEPYFSYISTYAPPGGEAVELVLLSDFEGFELPPTIVIFRRSFADRYPEVVRIFHEVYAEAALRLNETSRDELLETGLDVAVSLFFQSANVDLIGQDVLDAIPIPVFEPLGSLGQEQYEDIAQWILKQTYIYGVLPDYTAFVDWQYVQ